MELHHATARPDLIIFLTNLTSAAWCSAPHVEKVLNKCQSPTIRRSDAPRYNVRSDLTISLTSLTSAAWCSAPRVEKVLNKCQSPSIRHPDAQHTRAANACEADRTYQLL